MINICIDNHPSEGFVNRKNKGLGDLEYGEAGETNRIGRCLI